MEKTTQAILKDLRELAAIPSVKAAPVKGKPFGTEIGRALDWFLEKGRAFGLTALNADGYAGHLEIPGKPDGKLAGVLVHLDVVPAADGGWPTPPFHPKEIDGRLVGRGVTDDKGAAVVLLHVLKAVKERGAPLKNTVRLIAGCDEESGSACVRHYFQSQPMPDFGFSPDADFPLIFAEKHIIRLHITLKSAAAGKGIGRILGDFTENVVPEYAGAEINKGNMHNAQFKGTGDRGQGVGNREQGTGNREQGKDSGQWSVVSSQLADDSKGQGTSDGGQAKDKTDHCELCLVNCEWETVHCHGRAAHSMECFKGDNALWKLCAELRKRFPDDAALAFIADKICGETDGKKLGIACDDGISGALTCNFSTLKVKAGALELTLDVRCPVGKRPEEIADAVKRALPEGGTLEAGINKGFALEKDDPILRVLLDSYRKVTGREDGPKASGGGTYARYLKRAAAFGPMFEGTDYKIHAAGENLPVDEIGKLFEIYYNAVLGIGNL
ncbi:dipeptidase PepV [Clostridia bacterium]|nr:dipeptidase PepV [Clostridia bacterium]